MTMKRAYENARAEAVPGGWSVTLDGKALRSPAKRPLLLPTSALAEAIAAEWQAQGAKLRPREMPMMRLASIAIDLVATRRAQIVAETANYAATDLVCYRAEHPPELVARQHAVWQPLVDWAVLRYDAPLAITSSVLR
jgi:chaperone required for assembly of F1-ATPase